MRSGTAARRPQKVGDYLTERLLGVGGMAEVFMARRDGPHGFSKRVALKRILPQLACDPRLVAMFCDEARIQAALSHPNLVEVFDFGEHDGLPFIALEFVDGLSGAELIARVAARRRTVDLAPALTIVREVVQALEYVHQATDDDGRPLGIVHRDVAPSNILIGCMGQVKLGDFGIVRSTSIDARTVPGELKGKVGYVSPEQALGMPLDGRSDLFSLSVVLAELLICQPLFAGESELEVLQGLHGGNLRRLRSEGGHIPDSVRELLFKGLARWPEQRFQTASELGAAIDAVAAKLGLSLGAHVLCDWMQDLGLVALSSDVQQRPVEMPRRRRPPSEEFLETVTLTVGESESPPASIVDAIRDLCPENDVPELLAHAVSVPASANVTYRVRRPGGAVLGPLPLPGVLEMLATGRLGSDGVVSRNGAPFMPVPSMVELGRMLARPPYRFHEPIALYTEERWAVRLEQTPGLVFDIARQKRTGLLCARRGSEQVRLWFHEGALVFSSATDPRELLGARLVESDGLPRDRVERAVGVAWRTGQPLGAALIAEGLCTRERVDAALREQIWRRLIALFRFRVGEIAFVQGVRPGEEPVDLAQPFAFIARALLCAYAPDEVASVLERVERGGTLHLSADPGQVERALGLPPEETAALVTARAGLSLRGLMQEGVRAQAFDARAARRAVLVGLASGALAWQP